MYFKNNFEKEFVKKNTMYFTCILSILKLYTCTCVNTKLMWRYILKQSNEYPTHVTVKSILNCKNSRHFTIDDVLI